MATYKPAGDAGAGRRMQPGAGEQPKIYRSAALSHLPSSGHRREDGALEVPGEATTLTIRPE